jgi:DNA-binding response OmpR family regulator
MPGMDGQEALPKLLEAQEDLPILILTANSSIETAIRMLGMGASGYLLKPIDPDQILIRVREVLLERRQSLRRKEILREIQGIVSELRHI